MSRRTSTAAISVAGIPVAVTADDDQRLAITSALFDGCPATADAPLISVHHGRAAPSVPDRPADSQGAELEVWIDPTGVATRHRSGTCGRRIGDEVIVGGDARGGVDPARAFRLAGQLPLMDALARYGRHALHAASVEREGGAVLVLGPSGAGKSTFAYAGHVHGWRVMSDDLSLVVLDHEPRVYGLPKRIAVPRDAYEHPPHGSSELSDDERGRWVLPGSVLTAAGPLPLRAVVVLEHSDDTAEAELLPESPERIRYFLRSLPLGNLPSVARAFFPIAARLSRVPMYVYRHDRDPARRVAAVGEFLGTLSGGHPPDR